MKYLLFISAYIAAAMPAMAHGVHTHEPVVMSWFHIHGETLLVFAALVAVGAAVFINAKSRK